MKKFIKRITVFILSILTASCASAAFSACSSTGGADNGENTENNGSDNATVESLYGKWDEYEGVKLAFVDEEAYNDGEIDESKVLPELNCKLNGKYYMVADFDIQAPYDNDGKETVTAAVQIQPAAAVSATIQDTNSGTVSEETNDDITEIKATYKIPEKADSMRNMRLIIQLEAQNCGLVNVDLSFETSGEIQGVKTSKIEKSAVMGYTEKLEFKRDGETYSVTGIGDKTVKQIAIPNLVDGYYVTEIKASAFKDLTSIESIFIPNSVTKISVAAFRGCTGIKSIEVSSENQEYSSVDNCLLSKDGKTLILGFKDSIIPESVTEIGGSAFYGCRGMTSITIPESVTSIGEYALYGCSDLRSLTILGFVTSTGNSAFSGCNIESAAIPTSVCSTIGGIYSESLKTVTITRGGAIPEKAFDYCTKLQSVTILDGVKSIGEMAFDNCTALTEVSLPDSLTSIYWWAFHYCISLKNINIPTGLTSIYGSAFYLCKSLKTIEIPEGVTIIESSTFYKCTGLESVTIPSTVTKIGVDAFAECPLSSVTFKGTKQQWEAIEINGRCFSTGIKITVRCTDGDLTV